MNNVVDIAMSFRRLGYSIIPIQPKSKKPCIPWKRFQQVPAEETEIEEWAAFFPECGLGILTGKVSGNLVVLDIDPRNGGDKAIEGKHLPPTPCVNTGGGGFHYYFRHDKELPSGPIAPGLDLKAERGYVVAPPSIHASGRPYAWAPGLSPTDLERASVPDWILDLVARIGQSEEKNSNPPDQEPPDSADDRDILEVAGLIKPFWTHGQRKHVSLSLSGCLAKCRWPWEKTEKVIRLLSNSDEEAQSRLNGLKATYQRLEKGEKVKGYQGLAQIIPATALKRLTEVLAGRDPNEPIWITIKRIRKRKMPAVEKRRLVAECVRDDLEKKHGDFLIAAGPEHYFFEKKSRPSSLSTAGTCGLSWTAPTG